MRTKKVKIFILDNEEKIIVTVTKVLEAAGYNLKTFDDVTTMGMALEKELPDLFIIDPQMNSNQGLEFLKFRQGDKLIKKIPLIALTSHLGRNDITHLLLLGVHDYQIKPLNSRLLLSLIKKNINKETIKRYLFDDPEDAVGQVALSFTKVSETTIVAELPVKLTDDEDGQYRVISRELEDMGVVDGSLSLSQNTTFVSQEGLFRAYFRWRGLTEGILQKIRAGKF